MNHNPLKNLFLVCKNISSKYEIKWKNSFIKWELPDKIDADFSISLGLFVSYKTKINFEIINKEIIKEIKKNSIEKYFEFKFIEGYINVSFSQIYYEIYLKKIFYNKIRRKGTETINIEYVSANPTGELNLAHFRNAFIGDSLANVYDFLGYKVYREYYINDKGEQISSLVNSIYYLYCKINKKFLKKKRVEYISSINKKIAKIFAKKWKNKYVDNFKKKDFLIWKDEILSLIISNIKKDLKKCGIIFDIWFSESSLYKKNSNYLNIIEKFKKKNLVYLKDDAWFFCSKNFGDEKDRVIIKKRGINTYFYSDIAHHEIKIREFDNVINIWGADHHGYVKRMKAACQALDEKKKIDIVLVQTVSLLKKDNKKEKFSKRLGNTIELKEALKYLRIDELKFYLLEKEPDKSISINIKLLEENKEKTKLYYIQYAYARCNQIIKKSKDNKNFKMVKKAKLLDKKSEKIILNLLIKFEIILETIINEKKTHHLIHYLLELSKNFQNYYQNNRILDNKNLDLSSQRIFLIKGVMKIIKNGLKLLGIKTKLI